MRKRSVCDGFYQELDAAKERPGSCNCVSFAVLFALVLLVSEIFVFSFFKNLKSAPDLKGSNSSGVQVTENFSKIDLGDNSFQYSLSQGQFCSALPRNLACLISQDGIIVSGKISPYLPQNASVYIRPKIVDEKLSFEVLKCTIGVLTVPKFFVFGTMSTLNSSLSKQIPELDGAKVKNVELGEGVMLISAEPK